MNYRKESLLLGLIPPEDHSLLCGCGECKSNAPSLVELELSASQHPYKPFREMQFKFFDALINLVTQYEEEALEIFELPKIETVRQSVITGNSDAKGKFKITASQTREYKEMLSDWQHDLTADATLIKQDEEEDEQTAVMNWYLLLAFTIGLKRVKSQTIRNAPDDLKDLLANIDIAPELNNLYLQNIRKDALKRVKIKIADNQRDFVLKKLRQMSTEGRNPLYTARQLHKQFEGNAWYWNRLARSESALALGASFDSWAKAARATHEKWSAGGSRPCPICVGLDGNIWRIGEGPHPVTNTHPHCACERIAQYNIPQNQVNPAWRRATPYDQPYDFVRNDSGNLTVPKLGSLLN